MVPPDEGQLLRIFIGENDKYEGQPLFEWIVHRARPVQRALPFYAVWKGGAHSRIHTAKILRLSEDLPIVIEIVDTFEKQKPFCRSLMTRLKRVWLLWKKFVVVFTEVETNLKQALKSKFQHSAFSIQHRLVRSHHVIAIESLFWVPVIRLRRLI